MELVANVWPVVDSRTGFVLRYLARAYAMDGPDELVSTTLKALAPTDFRMGSVFRIPKRFTLASAHGTLTGCVSIGDFHVHQAAILEPAFEQLEKSFAPLQGIIEPTDGDPITAIGLMPRFPPQPYLLVTSLIEMPNGHLIPQVET